MSAFPFSLCPITLPLSVLNNCINLKNIYQNQQDFKESSSKFLFLVTLKSNQNCHIDIYGSLKCFVCVVFKELTLQYLGLSVISPLHTLPLQKASEGVCGSHSLSPQPVEG